jgi:hypothetical protein
MRVICPHCETRCDDNDTYCPSCGTSLSGAALEHGSDARGDRRQVEREAAPHGPAARTSSEEVSATTWGVPTASNDAPSEAESDFIPLRFETPNKDGRGGAGGRWILLGIGLIVLLAVGSAVALLREGDGDAPTDVPAIFEDPLATPTTAHGLPVVVAFPSPSDDAVSTPVQAADQALTVATPATFVQTDAASTPTTAVEGSTASGPVDTTSITEGARLQTDALVDFLSPVGEDPSPDGSTPGDGTGGGILTPADSDVPLIGPPERDATSQAEAE